MQGPEMDYDEWLAALREELMARGHSFGVSLDAAHQDYEMGLTPDGSATLFIEEYNAGQ